MHRKRRWLAPSTAQYLHVLCLRAVVGAGFGLNFGPLSAPPLELAGRAGQTKMLYPDDKLQFDVGKVPTVYVVASSVRDGAPATLSLQEFSNRQLDSFPTYSDVGAPSAGGDRVARADAGQSKVMGDEDDGEDDDDGNDDNFGGDDDVAYDETVENSTSIKPPEWKCQHCTFLNCSHTNTCSVCDRSTYRPEDRSTRFRNPPSRFMHEQASTILAPSTSQELAKQAAGGKCLSAAADQASANFEIISVREEMETSVNGDAAFDDDGTQAGDEQVQDEESATVHERATAGGQRSAPQRRLRRRSSKNDAAIATAAEAAEVEAWEAAASAIIGAPVSIATLDEDNGYAMTAAKRLRLSPETPTTTAEGNSSDGAPRHDQGRRVVDSPTAGSTTPQPRTASTRKMQARNDNWRSNGPWGDGGAVPGRARGRSATTGATTSGKRRSSSRKADAPGTASNRRAAGPSRQGKTTGDGIASSFDTKLASSNNNGGGGGGGGLGEKTVAGATGSRRSRDGATADERVDSTNGHQPASAASNGSHVAPSSSSDSDSATTGAAKGNQAPGTISGENGYQRAAPAFTVMQPPKGKQGKGREKGKGKEKGTVKGGAFNAKGGTTSGGRGAPRQARAADGQQDQDRFPDSTSIQDNYEGSQIAAWEPCENAGGSGGAQDDGIGDCSDDGGDVSSDQSSDM